MGYLSTPMEHRECEMIVGIVGLGRMGAAMAERLRSVGFDVIGWDHSPAANQKAAAAGLRLAGSAGEVAAPSGGPIRPAAGMRPAARALYCPYASRPLSPGLP